MRNFVSIFLFVSYQDQVFFSVCNGLCLQVPQTGKWSSTNSTHLHVCKHLLDWSGRSKCVILLDFFTDFSDRRPVIWLFLHYVTYYPFEQKIHIPYARDKTAVDLFHFSLFCLWAIREGGLFKKVVHLFNLPAGKLAAKKEHQLFVLLCSNQ